MIYRIKLEMVVQELVVALELLKVRESMVGTWQVFLITSESHKTTKPHI